MLVKILLSLYTVAFILLLILTVTYWVPVATYKYLLWIFALITIPYFGLLFYDLYKSQRAVQDKIFHAAILILFLPYHIYYIWFEYGKG